MINTLLICRPSLLRPPAHQHNRCLITRCFIHLWLREKQWRPASVSPPRPLMGDKRCGCWRCKAQLSPENNTVSAVCRPCVCLCARVRAPSPSLIAGHLISLCFSPFPALQPLFNPLLESISPRCNYFALRSEPLMWFPCLAEALRGLISAPPCCAWCFFESVCSKSVAVTVFVFRGRRESMNRTPRSCTLFPRRPHPPFPSQPLGPPETAVIQWLAFKWALYWHGHYGSGLMFEGLSPDTWRGSDGTKKSEGYKAEMTLMSRIN